MELPPGLGGGSSAPFGGGAPPGFGLDAAPPGLAMPHSMSSVPVPPMGGFAFAAVPPCQTLYVNNLNEKIKKQDLYKSLYGLFSEFGPVLDIHIKRTMKMRGQAFVSFKDINDATRAMQRLQGSDLFGKPMSISYSKEKSHVVLKMEGAYTKLKKSKRAAASGPLPGMPPAKRQEGIASSSFQPPSEPITVVSGPPAASFEEVLPNAILFVTGLPTETTKEMLEQLFSPHPGFKDVQMVPGNSSIAFIEFEDAFQSGAAMQHLQGFAITSSHKLNISFARQ